MSNQIVKILFRSGTDIQRREALSTGITFSNGEPAWVVDSNRLYVGDGQTTGGIPVDTKNFGSLGTLFGNYGGTGLSQEAYYALTAAEIGDFVYDRSTRALYALSSKSAVPPYATDFEAYSFTVLLDPSTFYFNNLNQLEIQQGGITPRLISQGCVGGGLVKYDTNAPITIAVNGIDNSLLAQAPANTVKLNPTNAENNIQDLYVEQGQFVGRANGTPLTALDFSVLLAQANFQGTNGVIVNRPTATSTTVSLCANIFQVQPSNTGFTLNILPPTTINSSLSVTSDITSTGVLRNTGGVFTNGALSAAQTLNCGNVTCGSVYTQNNDITTGSGSLYANNVNATGDVIAFYTSDKQLKTDITPIESPLEQLDLINGYTFTWSPPTGVDLARTGKDIGLIAQEVEKVVPWAVTTKSNGYLGVDYQRIVPYLVSCIKELKQEVETLKNEIRRNS